MSFIREDPIDDFELENLHPEDLLHDPHRALLQPIISHILSEADDKCDEIDLRGFEDFKAEKRRLFAVQKEKVDHFYARKHKQVETAHVVHQSNKANEGRLAALSARDGLLKDVLDEARQDLKKISADKNRYPHILKGLILQGLLQLMEDKVLLRCRKEDEQLVNSLLESVSDEQLKVLGVKPEITVDPTPLSSEIAGGVELYTKHGRIMVSSTLESRFGLISNQVIPQIRTALFGPNPNRAFFD